VIRTAVLAALLLAAASPALAAYGHSSVPAPQAEGASRFAAVNYGLVSRLMPGTTAEPLRFGDETAHPAGPTVIYALPDGKPAAQIDVTDPRQNPFMAQPERKPATPAR